MTATLVATMSRQKKVFMLYKVAKPGGMYKTNLEAREPAIYAVRGI
jgi:hypothetical protein